MLPSQWKQHVLELNAIISPSVEDLDVYKFHNIYKTLQTLCSNQLTTINNFLSERNILTIIQEVINFEKKHVENGG